MNKRARNSVCTREACGTLFAAGLLLVCCFASAISVVYVKHLNRQLFVELQSLERERDGMHADWGRLQLERSTWGTHDRVVRIAAEQLDLGIPAADGIVLVRP